MALEQWKPREIRQGNTCQNPVKAGPSNAKGDRSRAHFSFDRMINDLQ
jgi:hypothetical protein